MFDAGFFEEVVGDLLRVRVLDTRGRGRGGVGDVGGVLLGDGLFVDVATCVSEHRLSSKDVRTAKGFVRQFYDAVRGGGVVFDLGVRVFFEGVLSFFRELSVVPVSGFFSVSLKAECVALVVGLVRLLSVFVEPRARRDVGFLFEGLF